MLSHTCLQLSWQTNDLLLLLGYVWDCLGGVGASIGKFEGLCWELVLGGLGV